MAVQSDWMEKDFYAVLGVDASASQKDITKAYRRLARDLHPDTHPDDPTAEERFKDVSHAYDVLGDATKRQEYDDFRRMVADAAAHETRGGPSGGFASSYGSGGFRSSGFDFDAGDFEDVIDLDDLLGGMFGARAQRRARPARGRDHEATLEMDFEDAVRGITTTLTLTGDTGAREVREVKVRIPAGVDDGQRIRIPGKGGAAPEGGTAGDLYITVRVRPHPVFGRSGRDLTVTVPVSYPDLVLGGSVKVPTLDGDAVTVRIPPGTPSGRTLRVRGGGVKTAKAKGDLLVTVDVTVPTHVTEEQRALLEQLRGI